jgi:hypothetical protein
MVTKVDERLSGRPVFTWEILPIQSHMSLCSSIFDWIRGAIYIDLHNVMKRRFRRECGGRTGRISNVSRGPFSNAISGIIPKRH